MINVDDAISNVNTIHRKDDISSLTIEGKRNIYTQYFDTSNSRNYFK